MTPLTPRWDMDRVALVGCLLVGVIIGIFQATNTIADPFDAHLYWSSGPDHMYPTEWGIAGGYVYAPPLATLIGVLRPIGWPLFIVGWTTLSWFALWYCVRAWVPVVVVASFALVPFIGGNVVGYLFMGNVQLIMAAAIVASVRGWPGWSAIPVLTKLVGITLVWYVARREWRNLGIAIGATAVVVLVTFILNPTAWFDFLTFVTRNRIDQSPVPLVPVALPIRLAFSILLVTWGGRTDRAWTVPVAAGLAIPALYVWSFVPIWIGVIGVTWRRTTPLITWGRGP